MTESVSPSKTASLLAAKNADQVEADAIRDVQARVGGCLIDDIIAQDELADEYDVATNPNGNPRWAEENDARETAVSETIAEIERRIEVLSPHYPFALSPDHQILEYLSERSSSGIYEFCLAFATTQHDLKANPACQSVREFERTVGRLLKGFLHGDTASFYRFGFPPDGDRPTTMTAMLADLNQKTDGEWSFKPPQGAAAQAEQGDDAIDVVVWKAFGPGDRRIGKLFLLTQCACGDDAYWFGKRNDLNPGGFEAKWTGKISFAGVLKSLATPRHVSHPAIWHEGTCDGGILLDRARLTWMGESCLSDVERAECKARLAPHTQALNAKPTARLKKLKSAPPAPGKP